MTLVKFHLNVIYENQEPEYLLTKVQGKNQQHCNEILDQEFEVYKKQGFVGLNGNPLNPERKSSEWVIKGYEVLKKEVIMFDEPKKENYNCCQHCGQKINYF